MKSFRATFGLLAVFFLIIGAGYAAEFEVLSVETQKISMDLDPALQVSGVKLNTSVIGFGEHQMMFNGSSPEDGRLFLSIYSIYDEALKSLDPSEVIGIFLGRELSAMEDSGDSITGNWTAVSAAGQNVTVFTLSTPNPRVTFSSYDMAMWPLDEDSYVMMASVMQKDATERVINTLTFV